MKTGRIVSALTALTLALSLSAFHISADEAPLKEQDIDCTECTDTINNPGMGYTSTLWYTCKPGETQVKDPTGSLVLMFIDIGAFSSGQNGTKNEDGSYTEGTDYDLDYTFFDALRGTFENCRKNGCTIALRFRYDANGKTNPEPSTFEQLLKHISQIKESRILEDYKDILMFVESGFVGAWGEQHSGKYTSVDYKAKVLDAMLDCVPDPIPVTVRTPDTAAKLFGVPRNELDRYTAPEWSREARVGMYNDGYMGSDSDLGTYANRSIETDWLNRQTLRSYYGGEYSGALDWAKKYDTYLPENALPEMYKTHVSYINSNIYQLYKEYTFGEKYDTSGADNSAYYGQTVFKFIRDHIGYRFVLRDSKLSESVTRGGKLSLDFTVENTGFANPIREQNAELILEKNGNYVVTGADIDDTKWYSAQKSNCKLSFKIPGELVTGKWNAYLRLSVGRSSVSTSYMRTVRFANKGIWQPALGANLLGSFEVTDTGDKALLSDNSFYQTDTAEPKKTNGDMYTVNNIIIMDGDRSGDREWTEEHLIKQSDKGGKMYLNADESALYIMTEIDDDSSAPVYNYQLKDAETGESYWIYYASNGFVYFNKGKYDGCIFKRNGKYAEFKIPFGDVMGLKAGTKISSLRMFLQDSGNDWKLKEDMTAKDIEVPSNLNIYSAKRTVCMNRGDSITLYPITSAYDQSELDGSDPVVYPKTVTYQWYKDGKLFEEPHGRFITVKAEDSSAVGVYSVKIGYRDSSTSKTVDMCEIKEVFDTEQPSPLKGDTDKNGTVDIADAVLLKKYLIKQADMESISFDCADMDDDGRICVTDFLILKRKILGL